MAPTPEVTAGEAELGAEPAGTNTFRDMAQPRGVPSCLATPYLMGSTPEFVPRTDRKLCTHTDKKRKAL